VNNRLDRISDSRRRAPIPEAVQADEEAMPLASAAGQTNLLLTNQKLLRRYRDGQGPPDVPE
jgi:hypothetical protein